MYHIEIILRSGLWPQFYASFGPIGSGRAGPGLRLLTQGADVGEGVDAEPGDSHSLVFPEANTIWQQTLSVFCTALRPGGFSLPCQDLRWPPAVLSRDGVSST